MNILTEDENGYWMVVGNITDDGPLKHMLTHADRIRLYEQITLQQIMEQGDKATLDYHEYLFEAYRMPGSTVRRIGLRIYDLNDIVLLDSWRPFNYW